MLQKVQGGHYIALPVLHAASQQPKSCIPHNFMEQVLVCHPDCLSAIRVLMYCKLCKDFFTDVLREHDVSMVDNSQKESIVIKDELSGLKVEFDC